MERSFNINWVGRKVLVEFHFLERNDVKDHFDRYVYGMGWSCNALANDAFPESPENKQSH